MVWKHTRVPSLSKMTRLGLNKGRLLRLAPASATEGDTSAVLAWDAAELMFPLWNDLRL